jgi:hypothetical protein
MEKLAPHTSRRILSGWVVILILVFLHPLIMESFDHSHRDHCSFCLHFSSIGIVLPAFSFLPFLIFLGYALAIPLRKLASRFFLISSGRAPPVVS